MAIRPTLLNVNLLHEATVTSVFVLRKMTGRRHLNFRSVLDSIQTWLLVGSSGGVRDLTFCLVNCYSRETVAVVTLLLYCIILYH